jgi:DNA-binding NarL/FixJ family response regulator
MTGVSSRVRAHHAIREALRGRSYVSRRSRRSWPTRPVVEGVGEGTLRDLTPREREVLQLLAEGRSMKEVAAVLTISPRTVEFHKYRIMELLRVRTNAELVQQAIRLRLILP